MCRRFLNLPSRNRTVGKVNETSLYSLVFTVMPLKYLSLCGFLTRNFLGEMFQPDGALFVDAIILMSLGEVGEGAPLGRP